MHEPGAFSFVRKFHYLSSRRRNRIHHWPASTKRDINSLVKLQLQSASNKSCDGADCISKYPGKRSRYFNVIAHPLPWLIRIFLAASANKHRMCYIYLPFNISILRVDLEKFLKKKGKIFSLMISKSNFVSNLDKFKQNLNEILLC